MTTRLSKLMMLIGIVLIALAMLTKQAACSAVAAPVAGEPAKAAWTLDEAIAHLKLAPRDVYVQYIALQLARHEGRLDEVVSLIERSNPRWSRWRNRQQQVELFSIFSGQLAVQESLQLDALVPEEELLDPAERARRVGPGPLNLRNTTPAEKPPTGTVAVSELQGPAIKSHPWRDMLADKQSQVTGLVLKVPSDFYFISFNSLNKLLDATELANLYGAHMLNQASHEAQTQLVGERLKQQLAIEDSPLLRPFYDAVVSEVAVVGSDLFLREGSDVTLLFQTTQPALLQAKLDGFLDSAHQSRPDATRTTAQYLGIDYVCVATPDRQIQVYSAYPTPDLHVRSNSQAGLERVLAAIVGHNQEGQGVTRLGETDEFRFVRTLMPQGAIEEDGLIYLSDTFVRRLMSPELRVTQRRRQTCYNHLRMIGHAAMMHRTQTGKIATSLAQLAAAGCSPEEFGTGRFVCPDGGKYTLSADGITGNCSLHGYASYLTPCNELDVTHVTALEARAYLQFVIEYNRYWRQFFDPIAIGLQITPERYRIETIVLPLIDNTLYTTLARSLGGQPEPLDELPVPRRNIFSFAVRLNKAQLLDNFGLEELIEPEDPNLAELEADKALGKAGNSLRQIALALHNYADTHAASFPASEKDGLSWRVHLLPYLEEQELYSKFHLDEPWDSEHNRQLIAQMPAIFLSEDEKLNAAGKTRFVVPTGKGTVFEKKVQPTKFAGIRDGMSNTVLLLEASDTEAVPWTKPTEFDLKGTETRKRLKQRLSDTFLVGLCDGNVQLLRTTIDPATVDALLTRAGGEITDWQEISVIPPPSRFTSSGRSQQLELLRDFGLGKLLTKGLGNQIAFHACDGEPMFDLSLPQFFGFAVSMNRGRMLLDDDFLPVIPLVTSLNGPVYFSIPVQDASVVDEFLDRLDGFLAELAQRDTTEGWFRIEQDFYHLKEPERLPARCYSIGFGPLKWRFFWSRIGGGLYVASKREILDNLAALQSGSELAATSPTEAAHALVRIRPQNWDRVLETYQLGWEENSRDACLNNLGPLSSLSRALSAEPSGTRTVDLGELADYSARVYDVQYFCPDEGHYVIAPEGSSVSCSIHGTALEPRQSGTPVEASKLGQLLGDFRDLNVRLTFLEDGLHAVATIVRDPTTPEETPSQ